MKTKGDDFVVEANGRCFFCLATVPSQFSESCSLHSLTTLQYLSRYLKMDMRKIFTETGHVPVDLLSKVENARLKVQLCGDCSSLTESFSKRYRHLEKVEMEVASFANHIQRKLEGADKMGKAEQFLNVAEPDLSLANVGLKGKLEIIKVLREEVKQKCIDRCDPIHPFVKIQRLTLQQVKKKRMKINRTSQSTFTANCGRGNGKFEAISQRLEEKEKDDPDTIKMEENDSGPFLDDFNDYGNDNPDYIHGQHDVPTTQSHHDFPPVSINTSNTLRSGDDYVKRGSLSTVEKIQWVINPQTGKYKCHLCGKGFKRKDVCQTHYNSVHAKVKYKCNLCGKKLSQLAAYHLHVQGVHMGIRFKCQVCNKTFTQKGNLTSHLKRCSAKQAPELK